MERESFDPKELTNDWKKIIFDEACEVCRFSDKELSTAITEVGERHGFILGYKDVLEILWPEEKVTWRDYED